MTRKPPSHIRILIYRAWAIAKSHTVSYKRLNNRLLSITFQQFALVVLADEFPKYHFSLSPLLRAELLRYSTSYPLLLSLHPSIVARYMLFGLNRKEFCRLSCVFSVTWLKGHSQLMHMRISYNFLADLYITRHARETESEERIRNTLNKTCRVELVTSRNRDYSPYAIYFYTFGNSPIDLSSESQTSTNTSEFDHQKR